MELEFMQNLVVQKYGGTSVGTTDKIKNVANRIKGYHENGSHVVVVVSAVFTELSPIIKKGRYDNPTIKLHVFPTFFPILFGNTCIVPLLFP